MTCRPGVARTEPTHPLRLEAAGQWEKRHISNLLRKTYRDDDVSLNQATSKQAHGLQNESFRPVFSDYNKIISQLTSPLMFAPNEDGNVISSGEQGRADKWQYRSISGSSVTSWAQNCTCITIALRANRKTKLAAFLPSFACLIFNWWTLQIFLA